MGGQTRLLIALSFTCSMLLADTIVGPIGLSGSGTYSWAIEQGNEFKFSASGTNGIDTVTMTSIDRLPDGLPYSGLPDLSTAMSNSWLAAPMVGPSILTSLVPGTAFRIGLSETD